MNLIKARCLAVFTASLAIATTGPLPALAQYPEDTVRVVSAFPPGGGVDAIARYISASLTKQFNENVVVEDRPGAGGAVAANYVKTRAADGYSLLHTITSTVAIEPVFQELEYTKDDFEYVAGVVRFEAAIVAKGDTPWTDLNDLLEKVRAEGRKATFAGQTRLDRMVIASVNERRDNSVEIVPFKGGSDIIAAILGGHVDMGWSGSLHVPLVEAGQMKILAAVGDERYESYPETPTLTELGYPNSFNLVDIFAVPKGTPKEVIDALSTAILSAAQEPGFLELCAKYNLAPLTLGPSETTALIQEQLERTQQAVAQN